jgi:exosortase/archaeosortase family protein
VSSFPASRLDAGKLFTGRAALFGSLFAVAVANGLSEKILSSIADQGFLLALFETFDVSVVVWLAVGAGVWQLYTAPTSRRRVGDGLVAFVAIALILVPVPALSWVAATGIALFLIMDSAQGECGRRAGYILLAATVPAFWASVIMSVFNDWILAIDALLVGLFVGSTPQGNLVPFADDSGALWIAPGCSSFTNISLAILAIVVVVNITSGKWSLAKIGLAIAACASVVLINIIRISLIGYFPDRFDLIHGEVGSGIAGVLSTLVIAVFSWLAVRPHAVALD